MVVYPFSRSAITETYYHTGGGAVRWVCRFTMRFEGRQENYAVEDSIRRQAMKKACRLSDRIVEKGIE